MKPEDLYVGIDVAFAKEKRLPICFANRVDGTFTPLAMRSLRNKPPAGKGNVATFSKTTRLRFAKDVSEWLKAQERKLGAKICRIAIDAPSDPPLHGPREAEVALGKSGISYHQTPSLERFEEKMLQAQQHLEVGGDEASVPFAMHWWMLIGFELFDVLRDDFECIEVYPQAIVRTMGCVGAHKSKADGLDSQVARFAQLHQRSVEDVEGWIAELGFGSRDDKFDAMLSAWVASLTPSERVPLGVPPNDSIWIPKIGEIAESSSTEKESSVPTLGLDLDGTITEAPKFFAAWTQSWPGRVIIITYRNDREKTIADLEHHQIRYDELVLVDRMDGKAAVIAKHGVTMYVDDQPEMLFNVPDHVSVMLFRNEGNFDFADRRWMFSDRTGKQV